MVKTLNEQEFYQAIYQGSWVVEFWSDSCGPCKAVAPALEHLSHEFQTTHFGKVNVDQEIALALQQQVLGVPTVIIYKDGMPHDFLYSLYSVNEYRERIKSALG
ncbi:thioredoxin family protein [Deinococcus xinjiangensis]|uniref:thioredoxin family protein n=1 Tax=Deinococcus xinjiangensis TaxID=457454 RepID=UPI00336550E2